MFGDRRRNLSSVTILLSWQYRIVFIFTFVAGLATATDFVAMVAKEIYRPERSVSFLQGVTYGREQR